MLLQTIIAANFKLNKLGMYSDGRVWSKIENVDSLSFSSLITVNLSFLILLRLVTAFEPKYVCEMSG